MKIRTDYVTNSSSSSFIVAKKEELSEKQKDTIVQFVVDEMLGEKLLAPDSTEEQIQLVIDSEEVYIGEHEEEMIREALKEGKAVYGGQVEFECCEEHYVELFEKLWELLENSSKEEFVIIDGDLSY